MSTDQDATKYDFDYSDGAGDTVVLTVRPGNTYGAAPAGSRVRLARADLRDRSTLRSCMSDEEIAEAERKRAEREAKRPPTGRVKAAVDAAIAALRPREEKKPGIEAEHDDLEAARPAQPQQKKRK